MQLTGEFLVSCYKLKRMSKMNSLLLKLLAVFFMVIDHMGLACFDNTSIFRVFGRIAFPIFAFMIANGYEKTKNRYKYISRLFLFAIFSELPYDLMTYGKINDRFTQNVLFTFTLGCLSIFLLNYIKISRFKFGLITILIATILAGDFLSASYGSFGVFLVLAFYICKNSKLALLLSLILINGYYSLVHKIYIQNFAVLSIIPIILYNGQKGYSKSWLRYIFYIFYPLHMLLIFYIKSNI